MTDGPVAGTPVARPLSRGLLQLEVVTVLLVVVLPWTAAAIVSMTEYLSSGARRYLVTVHVTGNVGVDVAVQCVAVLAGAMGVVLVAYLLARSGESLRAIGLRFEPVGRTVLSAIGFTVLFLFFGPLVIGAVRSILGLGHMSSTAGPGIGAAYLPLGWMASLRAGVVEETVVCGYLLWRLAQLGWTESRALTTSIVVRCSYHVYGGLPLVVFTAVFGFVLGRYYLRTRRLGVVVLTHVLYDAVAFTIAFAH
jgi:membrane protease YdiL (CAAX protease family)